jgi:hypothetical protein
MRHYIPLQTRDGWAVCYLNHRREFVSVMECATLEAAYIESVNHTIAALEEAARVLEAAPKAKSVYQAGNRFVRGH